MSDKKTLLFLNGEIGSIYPNFSDYSTIFAVDGAYNKVKNIVPINGIIGDLDSIENLDAAIVKIYTPDQNYTDFEKTLKYLIKKNYHHVDIYNASGGEGDHYLGNLSIAMQYHKQISIRFFDDHQTYYYVNHSLYLKEMKGKTISLFPFPQTIISSHGLKWELKETLLEIGKDIGIRNKAIDDDIMIKHHSGGYYIFISR